MNIFSDFVAATAARAVELLGPRLAGVYAIGSLAHGGFSERVSDIDVALLLREDVGAGLIESLLAGERLRSPELAARLSVFWSDRGFSFGRFPVLDRIDLIDHGVRVLGEPRGQLTRPSLGEIHARLREHSIPYWAAATHRYAAGGEADKELLRCLLYPARLVYTWETGRITSNDEAVAYLAARRPAGVRLEPVQAALAYRSGERDASTLDEHRPALEAQYRATLLHLDIAPPVR